MIRSIQRVRVARIWSGAGLIIGGIILGKLFWWLPFLLAVPILMLVLWPDSLALLLGIAIMAELFSVSPFGIVSAVVLIPYVMRFIGRGVGIDVSFSYLAFIISSGALQLVLLGSPALVADLPDDMSWLSLIDRIGVTMPWWQMGFTLLMSTILVFSVSVYFHYNRPS